MLVIRLTFSLLSTLEDVPEESLRKPTWMSVPESPPS